MADQNSVLTNIRDRNLYGTESNNKLRQINQTLCKLVDTIGSLVDNSSLNTLLQEISDKLTLLINENKYDFELLCSSVDNRFIVLKFNSELGTSELVELDGSNVTDGSVGVKCNSNLESDLETVCINNVEYIRYVIKENGILNGFIFYTDQSGSLIPTLVGIVNLGKCVQSVIIPYR